MSSIKTWVLLGVAIGLGVGVAACSDATANSAGAGEDALGDDAGGSTSDGASSLHAAVCPPLPDGGFAANPAIGPAASASSGSVQGSAVTCSLCDVGAVLYVQTSQDSVPIVTRTLYFANAADGEDTCAIPGDSSSTRFEASVVLSDIQPGTYASSQSSSASACTNIGLTYELPSTSTVDCHGASGPNCPAGCGISLCIDGGVCSPCQGPSAPGVEYTAVGPCDSESAFGSWQVVLTSVTPSADGDGGLPAGTVSYVVHGSITADLIASTGDGSAPTGDHAALSLTF
jgi:hypothetical protein